MFRKFIEFVCEIPKTCDVLMKTNYLWLFETLRDCLGPTNIDLIIV